MVLYESFLTSATGHIYSLCFASKSFGSFTLIFSNSAPLGQEVCGPAATIVPQTPATKNSFLGTHNNNLVTAVAIIITIMISSR